MAPTQKPEETNLMLNRLPEGKVKRNLSPKNLLDPLP